MEKETLPGLVNFTKLKALKFKVDMSYTSFLLATEAANQVSALTYSSMGEIVSSVLPYEREGVSKTPASSTKLYRNRSTTHF